jgi:hypothetical protein
MFTAESTEDIEVGKEWGSGNQIRTIPFLFRLWVLCVLCGFLLS